MRVICHTSDEFGPNSQLQRFKAEAERNQRFRHGRKPIRLTPFNITHCPQHIDRRGLRIGISLRAIVRAAARHNLISHGKIGGNKFSASTPLGYSNGAPSPNKYDCDCSCNVVCVRNSFLRARRIERHVVVVRAEAAWQIKMRGAAVVYAYDRAIFPCILI